MAPERGDPYFEAAANHAAWDSDADPIADVESYEEAGGGWTFRPGASHGQVVVVLQLDSSKNDSATPIELAK